MHTTRGDYVYLVAGSKKGVVTFWGLDISVPQKDPKTKINNQSFIWSGRLDTDNGWVTSIAWKDFQIGSEIASFLFLGTSDGNITVYQCILAKRPDAMIPFMQYTLLYKAGPHAYGPITSIVCPRTSVSELYSKLKINI
jgi:hypothetical protein